MTQQANQYNTVEPIEFDPSQQILFNRINNHLLFHWTPLTEVWTSTRLCVTLAEFQEMLFKMNFTRGKDQFHDLHEKGVDFITLDKLIQGVKQWKRHDKDVLTFIEKQKSQSKQTASPVKQKKHDPQNDKFQKYRVFEFEEKQQEVQQKSRITKSSFNNQKTKQYLQKKHDNELKNISKLNETLIRAKNESHYELTIKIGQINDICKKLKNDVSFLIITTQDNNIQIVERQGKSNSQRVISQKMFDKKYQELKTANNNLSEEIEGTLEKDLKQTLVEVMYLSDELEKQISLLQRKGVNSC